MNQRIDVLDHGYVELIDTMPREQLDWAVVDAARVSYAGERYTDEARNLKLLRYLWEHGHTSPLEMVELKFRVKAPILVWRQLGRYRMSEMNEQSGRYGEYEDEFYVPTEWRGQDQRNKQSSSGTIDDFHAGAVSSRLRSRLKAAREDYQWALQFGIAREQARLFLPAFCLYSTAIWKLNAHSLIHVIRQRDHTDAQHETREYARALKAIMREVMPETARLAFGEDA